MEQKAAEILHFHFFIACRIVPVTYFCENEVENLPNGDIHFVQIPDFGMVYLENHLAH